MIIDTNRKVTNSDIKIKSYIDEIKKVIKLIDEYGALSFGRDFVLVGRNCFSLQKIIISVELTLSNLCVCCENGCISDANILMRKYRDDMFFYLFILNHSKNTMSYEKYDIEIEQKIEDWIHNKMKDLYIGDILKGIQANEKVRNLVKQYKLKDSFDEIADYFNNYVHSNGYGYYNENLIGAKRDQLYQSYENIVRHLKYITTVFLVILILLSPGLVMAYDYILSLEEGVPPLENSQYIVERFIEVFLQANIDFIDSSCYDFLQANTCMHLTKK